MKYGVIGIGNLGTSLVINIDSKGLDIAGVYSRNQSSIDNLNSIINSNYVSDLKKVIENSDTIFIAVKDDEIEKIDKKIHKDFERNKIEGKIFLHMSGFKTSDILKNIKEMGGIVGSLHPIQTFPDRKGNKGSFHNITCSFEGDNRVLKKLEMFFDVFKMDILKIEKENKTLYHASAVILCNMLSVISYMGEKVFESIGIERKEGYKAFRPLMERTLANILENGSVSSLSGPISRGDYETVNSHLDRIKENIPEIINAYEALTKISIRMALEKGTIDIDKYDELSKSLSDFGGDGNYE